LSLKMLNISDNLSSHPPPDEPVFLKNDFENLEENSMMVPVICSSSVFQPEDKLMQNYVEWKALSVCQCHIIMSIGWPPTLTVMSSKVFRFYRACHIPVFG
jgi:hypothetical protein